MIFCRHRKTGRICSDEVSSYVRCMTCGKRIPNSIFPARSYYPASIVIEGHPIDSRGILARPGRILSASEEARLALDRHRAEVADLERGWKL